MSSSFSRFWTSTIAVGALTLSCSSQPSGQGPNDVATGGVVSTGGATASGGAVGSGGTVDGTTGGSSSGGLAATGGGASGGGSAGGSGGASGGASATGGAGAAAGSGGSADDGIQVPVAATPDERHLLVRDEGKSQVHYIDLGDSTQNWTVDVPAGRELQLVGDNRFLIGTENGYEERSVVDGSVEESLTTFAGTVAARRLRNGNTLLVGAGWQGETGIALLEVDDAGTEQNRVVYSGFDYVRLVRPTSAGTYLVTSDLTIFEGDTSGNVVWQVQVQDSTEPHSWKALRLENGQTVIATGYEASLQFFSSEEQFLGRLKGPGDTTPNFYCDFQILSSGNYLVTNWQGHGEDNGNLGHQLVELTPDGNKAWSWKQDASYISSVQAAILLDGLNLGKLHVEDTTGELVPVD